MDSFENLVDLNASLVCFEAFLYDVRRELELTESNEVAGNEVEDLIISFLVIELEHVLHEVITVRIFDQKIQS